MLSKDYKLKNILPHTDKKNVCVCLTTFKQLYEIDFKTPPFQPALDEDKIEGMIKRYLNNPDHFIMKSRLTVGIISKNYESNPTFYIIDGQHRLEMARKLHEIGNIGELEICYYRISSDNDMKELFKEVNYDSYKNLKYTALEEFQVNNYDRLKKHLVENYKEYFSKTKKETNKLFTVDEFMDGINEYIKKFDNFDLLLADLLKKNETFYSKIQYNEYSNVFYKDEVIPITNKFICGLKKSNFINYVLDNEIPNHEFKYSKSKIPPRLRIMVWGKYYGENKSANCPICNIVITSGPNGFHCGHIISEKNGGKTILENLKPICKGCNLEMGSKNWT